MQPAAEHPAVFSGLESTFAWKARDSDGSVCSGTMTALSRDDVANRLRSDGRFVISIRDSASGTLHVAPSGQFRPRLKRSDTIAFFRQLSVMLSPSRIRGRDEREELEPAGVCCKMDNLLFE